MKVNIFGSCYSRELFNYQEKYIVDCYVMQQSIFTLYSKPLRIPYELARGTDNSNFKKRMMYYEFNKLGLKIILENKSDFLVIDFADCRYDIYEFDEPKGVKIIYTHESRATFANLEKDENFKNIKKHYCNVVEDYDENAIKKILKRFCKEILLVYKPEQIILNRISMSNKYYESGKEHYLIDNFHYSRYNFIKKIENIFIDIIPDCKILYSKYEPLLNINHKFGGPHPLHFENIYYKYRMNLLECLMEGKYKKQADENYKNIYNKYIKDIKNKINDDKKDVSNSQKVD